MNKIFRIIGILSLICFSFFITSKTSMLAKEMDEIMIKIKNEKYRYEYKSIDATINGNQIIPGKCGMKVNIDKTYNEMKKIGMYDYHLYQYDYYLPKVNIYNNRDKYIISGNKYKSNIYIFIELTELNKKHIYESNFTNYNFIVNSLFYINNLDLVEYIYQNNNSILIKDTSYKRYKYILKKYKSLSNKNIYCYSLKDTFLSLCSSNGSLTIKKIEQITSNYLYNIKRILNNGVFINIELSNNYLVYKNEIEKYIEKKGLYISNIENNLVGCEELYK